MDKCSVVKDLYPLFEENLLSQESKQFVREHLNECEICQAELLNEKEGKLDQNIFAKKEKNDLEFLTKSIKKEKFRYGRALAFICLAVVFIIISILTKPISLEYKKDLFREMSTGQDNMLIFSKDIAHVEKQNDGRGIYIKASTNKWRQFFPRDEQIAIDLDKTLPNYYVNEKTNAVLIAGESEDEGLRVLPKLVLNYYFLLAAILSFVLLVNLLLGIKKNNRRWKLIAFAIPVSYMLGSITIKGFSGATFYPGRDLFWILLLAICYFMIFYSNLIIKESKI